MPHIYTSQAVLSSGSQMLGLASEHPEIDLLQDGAAQISFRQRDIDDIPTHIKSKCMTGFNHFLEGGPD